MQSLTPCVSASGGEGVSVEWKHVSRVRSNGSLIPLTLIDRAEGPGCAWKSVD
jgi:hypothetical protein